QPVKPADVAAHLSLTLETHEWVPPALAPNAEARLKALDPQGLTQFHDKVADAARAAAAHDPLTFTLAATWNKKDYPPAPELVVFEVTARGPTESWVDVAVDSKVPSPQGKETPGKTQSFTIKAEPTFFVDGFRMTNGADPESHNPIKFRSDVSPRDVRAV